MKYLVVIFLIILSIHPFSYARYNWKKKNKLAAIGCVLLTVLSILLPLAVK